LNAAAALLDHDLAEKEALWAFSLDVRRWSYGQLRARVAQIADVLVRECRLVPGNRVLLYATNSPMAAACWLAVLRAGGICIAAIPQCRARELAGMVECARISHALCDLGLAEEMANVGAMVNGLDRVLHFTPWGDSAKAELDRLLRDHSANFPAFPTLATDPALISFTSGTTARPKAAVHCHAAVVAASRHWPQGFPVGPDDVVVGTSSFGFSYGISSQVIVPLARRASVALIPRFDPDALLWTVERYRATVLHGVPTAFHALMDALPAHDIGSLRLVGSAGEHPRTEIAEQWFSSTGLPLCNGLGTTEMLAHVVAERPSAAGRRSLGQAIPGYEIQVVDGAGNPLPPGTEGLLAIRGPTGCRYLGDDAAQRRFVRSGWNVPGDLVIQDEDGVLWYRGRADELIVSAGYNVSPGEVEDVLSALPEVAECAVLGAPDPVRGKVVHALVVLAANVPTSAELAERMRETLKRSMSAYKVPRSIDFVDALPRTASGKIIRNRLLLPG
jgi:2-aminobenzoate-CoA ligase